MSISFSPRNSLRVNQSKSQGWRQTGLKTSYVVYFTFTKRLMKKSIFGWCHHSNDIICFSLTPINFLSVILLLWTKKCRRSSRRSTMFCMQRNPHSFLHLNFPGITIYVMNIMKRRTWLYVKKKLLVWKNQGLASILVSEKLYHSLVTKDLYQIMIQTSQDQRHHFHQKERSFSWFVSQISCHSCIMLWKKIRHGCQWLNIPSFLTLNKREVTSWWALKYIFSTTETVDGESSLPGK